MFTAVLFYLFSVVLVLSAAMVVSARNPVHSVLFLITAFFNAAALFLIAEAEFLAFILIIVYVGAVAVLFLFVVMMLDVDFVELRSGFQRYLPIGIGIGALLLAELIVAMWGWSFAPEVARLRFAPAPTHLTNTVALGQLLYTKYIFQFQAAGLVLLVAMIGAIVLTLRERRRSRHQIIRVQTERDPSDTMELVEIGLGAGVKSIGIFRPKVAEPGDIDTDPLASEPGHGSAGVHEPAGASHPPEGH
jgi:NADH-quinone oxidoreductase subunit J